MDRNDDDDRHRSSRRGPHFFMGSTEDPNEFLEDVVTSVGGAGRRRANDYDTVLMDACISCCDKRLRRVLSQWREHGIPGVAGKLWYAMKEQEQPTLVESWPNGKDKASVQDKIMLPTGVEVPDMTERPTWASFKAAFLREVKVDDSTDQSMAYDETTKRQRLPGKLHVMDYKHNLIRAKVFLDEARLDACERIDAIQAFIGTIPDKNPKFLEKEIGQGNDVRRTLVRAQTTDQLKTLKQHFDKFILIDDYLRKQAKALGAESHLVNPGKVEEQGVMYADAPADPSRADAKHAQSPEVFMSMVAGLQDGLEKERTERRAEMAGVEARFDAQLRPIKEEVTTMNTTMAEMNLGIKSIAQKLASAPTAEQQQQWPPQSNGYQQWQPSGWNSSKGGKGKGGKGKGGKGWSGGRTVRLCWNCNSPDHMMAHCDKPVKRTQVNSVEECIQRYDCGGANQFSSWELVNQFSDSDNLQWDHQEQAYWVGPADEETAWSTACKWPWLRTCFGLNRPRIGLSRTS